MGRLVASIHLTIVLAVAGTSFAARRSESQEIRAFWADGFAEGFKSPEQVDTLIRRLQTANCNAIFAQVRKGGDAYYLSRYEPWAKDNPQRFDALAYLIQKARACKPRIQVHAWINTFAVGKTHGNPYHIALAHPDWKSFSDTGEDFDGEATKVDPGHPDAADWTFRVYMDVLRNYDVDGIHFDFVRYGCTDGKGRFGYNPVSVARFNARYGRSGQPKATDPLWKQWRRDQVTALVRKVYAMAQGVKPRAAVSAATITWMDGPHDKGGMSARRFWNEKSPGMNRVFQDWRSWMEEGILDINCQMSYFQEPRHPDYFRHWIEWGKQNQYRRWVVPSSGVWLNTIPDSIKQIEAIRKPGKRGKRAAGVLLYSYAGTNATAGGGSEQSEEFFAALAQPSSHTDRPPFDKPAEFPVMSWKKNPKLGHLKGFVLTTDSLSAVDGAKITLIGKVRRTQRTDGTGFYAFVDLPPGAYRVTVEAAGYSRRQAKATVKAGVATDSQVMVGAAQERFVSTLPEKPLDGEPIRLSNAIVAAGTDTCIGSMIVRDSADERGRARRVTFKQPQPMVYQPGDVVAIIGTARYQEGEAVIEAEHVRLIGLRPADADGAGRLPSRVEDTPEIGGFSAGRIVRIRGRAQSGSSDRATLDSQGVTVEVMLTGRKPPGVEASPSVIPAPELGSTVEVDGVMVWFQRSGERRGIRIFPISADAVRVLPATFGERLAAAARWAWIPLALAILPYWLWRRRRLA